MKSTPPRGRWKTTVPITPDNILFHELVGLRVRVSRSPNQSLVGIEGVIVDETMNTIIIARDDRSNARVLKNHQEFKIILPDGRAVLVPGALLVGRPWDRLKNVGKKRYNQ